MSATPWTASYPPNLRWDSEIPVGAVDRILDDAVARWPERVAVEFMGRRFSFRELGSLVARAAKGFQALGVGPGVHVALYLPNTPHYVVSFFGVLKAGGVVVNCSPLDADPVLEQKIIDSQAELAVTLDLQSLYPRMERLLAGGRLRTLVVGTVGGMTAQPDAVNMPLRMARQVCDVRFGERCVAFAQLVANDGQYVAHDIGRPQDALAVLQFTGGTTGAPRAAMLTHANLSAANHQYVLTFHRNGTGLQEGAECFLSVLPPFHVYALSLNMLLGLRLGATQVLHMQFDPEAVLKDLVAKRVTVFIGVPTMYAAFVGVPGLEKFDLRAVKFCGSGGAPLPADVQQRFTRTTGLGLTVGWGMTETGPAGTFTPPGGPKHPGSCGVPVPGLQLRIAALDNPDAYLPADELGELVVSGPNVIPGYWGAPEANAQAFNRDGFFRTGDIGRMDAQGWLTIVDRTKDMLLCSGFNVYPRLIEEAIAAHPSVAEVGVVGMPDDYRGQAPKACVVLKAGAPAPTLGELQAFLKDRIGRHEMIGALDIRAALPKTPLGKLCRRALLDEQALDGAA